MIAGTITSSPRADAEARPAPPRGCGRRSAPSAGRAGRPGRPRTGRRRSARGRRRRTTRRPNSSVAISASRSALSQIGHDGKGQDAAAGRPGSRALPCRKRREPAADAGPRRSAGSGPGPTRCRGFSCSPGLQDAHELRPRRSTSNWVPTSARTPRARRGGIGRPRAGRRSSRPRRRRARCMRAPRVIARRRAVGVPAVGRSWCTAPRHLVGGEHPATICAPSAA